MGRALREWIRRPWVDLTPRERLLLRRFASLAILIAVVVFVLPFAAAMMLLDREAKARLAGERRAAIERTFDSCVETNMRHDRTIEAMRKLAGLDPDGKSGTGDDPAHPLSPEATRAAEARLSAVKLIIDALAPHRDCDALIKIRFPD